MEQQPHPTDGYVSANRLAELFETTPSTIWRWARKGKLPKPVKLGEGTTRWHLGEVRAALEKIKGPA